jgi:TetR/AcrR family transcriptional repressor of nem operon
MRVTRKQAEVNRQRIIDSAMRLFGQRGVDAVGVAEVMGEAGFTHGGFYNHFRSKEQLVTRCRSAPRTPTSARACRRRCSANRRRATDR